MSVYIDTSASGLNSVDEPQIEQILKNWSGILGVTSTPLKSPSGPPTNKTGTKTNPIWIISASPNVPSGFDALTSSFYPADGTYQDTSVSTLFQSSWLAPATATAVEDLMGHEIVHAFGEGECVATANATCSGVAANLLTAFVRKADEGTVGRLIVEAIILLSVRTQADGGKALRAAAQVYGVDTEAITLKVKQEFAAKDKARKASKPEPKATVKAKRLA